MPVCPGTKVVPLPSANAGRCTALLLFPHAAVERRHVAASLSGDGRIAAYLGTPRRLRAVRALRVRDEAALEASVDDCIVMFEDLPWRAELCRPVDHEARGPRRWFVGLTVVGTLVTSYDADTLGHQPRSPRRGGELSPLSAAVVRLPDGRYAVMPGAYGSETVFLDRDCVVFDGILYGFVCNFHKGLYSAAWHKYVAQMDQQVWQFSWGLDHEVRLTAAAVDESAASPIGAAAQLASRLAPAEADAVRGAMLGHMTRFAVRRVSAERIRRTWLRYDGAPHGPWGRFLRDLEGGWRPDATCDADAAGVGGGVGGSVDVGAGVGALRLFADGAAYTTYADARREALRRVLACCAPTERVRLRLASLAELRAEYRDRAQTQHDPET